MSEEKERRKGELSDKKKGCKSDDSNSAGHFRGVCWVSGALEALYILYYQARQSEKASA